MFLCLSISPLLPLALALALPVCLSPRVLFESVYILYTYIHAHNCSLNLGPASFQLQKFRSLAAGVTAACC